jgi:retron-type reverse transcriptase
MKTYKNLYSQVYDFQNLLKSYYQARKCKSKKKYIIDFEWNLEKNLFDIQKKLKNRNYQFGQYQSFYVSDPKERLIFAAPFRDRIVHHALCNIIEPIFDRGFIFDSYACRRNKGTHKAVFRLKKFMRNFGDNKFYVFKGDIRKYFPSINRNTLFQLIEKKIADQDALRLIRKIIDSLDGRKGIPIGNLTSQLFANIYLNELDQFAKHQLKVKDYCRYVDDFVLLHQDRRQLKKWRTEIKEFLENKLKLKLHPKKQEILPAKIGIDFLGYHIFINHILVRQSTVRRFFYRLKSGRMSYQSIYSYLGHFKFADSFGLMKKINRIYAKRYTNFSQNLRIDALGLHCSQ